MPRHFMPQKREEPEGNERKREEPPRRGPKAGWGLPGTRLRM